MGSFTRDNTELAVDIDGAGQQHRAQAGGMTIALERWNVGLDTAEWFAGLPGGACQEQHWGYCLRGQVTMRYADGATEVVTGGQAYYIRLTWSGRCPPREILGSLSAVETRLPPDRCGFAPVERQYHQGVISPR